MTDLEKKMKKKLKRGIWEETPFKFGIYKHKKTGKEAVAKPATNNKRYDWEIHKGKKQKHPLFRITFEVYEEGTGNFFFNKSLKDYEFVRDLDNSY